jgi:hypothetical protein
VGVAGLGLFRFATADSWSRLMLACSLSKSTYPCLPDALPLGSKALGPLFPTIPLRLYYCKALWPYMFLFLSTSPLAHSYPPTFPSLPLPRAVLLVHNLHRYGNRVSVYPRVSDLGVERLSLVSKVLKYA